MGRKAKEHNTKKKTSARDTIALVLVLLLGIGILAFTGGFGLLKLASVYVYGSEPTSPTNVTYIYFSSQNRYNSSLNEWDVKYAGGGSLTGFMPIPRNTEGTELVRLITKYTNTAQLTWLRYNGVEYRDGVIIVPSTPTPVPTSIPVYDSEIYVWSNPPASSVAVDGVNQGTTADNSYLPIPVKSGVHTIEVFKWGYYANTQTIEILPNNKSTKLNIYLTAPVLYTPAPTAHPTPAPTVIPTPAPVQTTNGRPAAEPGQTQVPKASMTGTAATIFIFLITWSLIIKRRD